VAVSVAELPIQIDVGLAAATITGPLFTNTVMVRVPVQPPVAPITVYVVLTVGQTITVDPLLAKPTHVYDVAPLAVSVAQLPVQTVAAEVASVTVGFGVTFTVTFVMPGHPNDEEPVTV
jgi:hypothetical protein